MKILFFSDNFPPETNAGALRVSERAEYWANWNHDVTVLTSCPNKPQGKAYPGFKNSLWSRTRQSQGLNVVRVWTFIAPNEGVFLRVLDFLSYMVTAFFASLILTRPSSRPDVIVASSPQFFAAVAGWASAKLRGIPFVMEVADLWPASVTAVGAMKKGFLTKMAERLELFLYRQSVAVVVLTESFARNLISRGIDAKKIHVIRNGVKLEIFEAAKQAVGPSFVVGYIGTLGMAQGLTNLVHAAELVKDENLEFRIVGDGAEKNKIRDAINERQLKKISLVGPVSREQVSQQWEKCNLALIHLKNDPVFAEVIPSKMFEAMAMGLPILLVSPKGEASDLLTNLQCGEWVPAGRPDLLAQAVMRWSKRKDLQDIGDRARNCVQMFTRERQARDVIKVLEAVI